ncbi:hypothetical protein [Sulfitobacter aestuariivivens]|uniref:Uncharacterized protein n=1 Tax=Sulfitobacter aestuariivivens TaxID=2766981 RepID=A0A927D261_9RHOB|nr:hypothetical protein [Sulfitobacter aestuariivivens]MBD3663021.1 hypothetical protein [Sulfitobacter aestuariivivens]
MSGSNDPIVIDTIELLLGCDPQVCVTIDEKSNGALFFHITSADGEPADIDGFFFDLSDDSEADNLNVFPGINTLGLTDFSATADSEDTLANGAQTADPYDVKLQFGTVNDSTEGSLEEVSFVVFTNDGSPLSLSDLDLDSLATVVDSDTSDGQVLLVNEDGKDGKGGPDTPDDPDDGVCEFLIEGEVNVTVTLTELANGELQVDLSVLGADDENGTGAIGDLRGFFFNTGNDGLLDAISVTGADVTDSEFDANSVSNLGNGANMNGGGRSPFDGGVEIGRQGLRGNDDIQETSFILSHPDGLSIDDFTGEEFGIRLTSVGEEDGPRNGSLKLTGECPDDPPPPVCDDQYALSDVMALFTVEVPDEHMVIEDDVPLDGPTEADLV